MEAISSARTYIGAALAVLHEYQLRHGLGHPMAAVATALCVAMAFERSAAMSACGTGGPRLLDNKNGASQRRLPLPLHPRSWLAAAIVMTVLADVWRSEVPLTVQDVRIAAA